MMRLPAFFAAVAALILCVAESAGAQAPEVGLVYKPGDTVRVVVSFQHPVALDGGRFYFRLQGEPRKNQRGFATEFGGGEFRKISDAEYELAGQVSPAFASGSWRLDIVDVSTQGVTRRYNFGVDFKKEISIRIENPRHVEFPDIKDVTVKPPKD